MAQIINCQLSTVINCTTYEKRTLWLMRKLCSVLCAHMEVFPSILNEDATLGGGTDKQSLYVVDGA